MLPTRHHIRPARVADRREYIRDSTAADTNIASITGSFIQVSQSFITVSHHSLLSLPITLLEPTAG